MNRTHPFVMRSFWSLLAGVTLSLTGAGGAALSRAAEAPPATGSRSLIAKNCAADVDKLCAGVEAGGGRLARCLHGHQDELQLECKQALERGGWKLRAAAATAAATAAAPAAEAPPPPAARPERPAPSAAPPGKSPPPGPPPPPPPHGPSAPPAPHEGEAGPGPGHMDKGPGGPGGGPAHARMEAQMSDMRAACGTDVEKFCKGVKPGMGRIARCLGEHAAELAPACKTKVDAMLAALGSERPLPGPPIPELGTTPLGTRPPPGPPVPPPPPPAH